MSKQNGATIYYIVPGSPIVQSIVIYDYELKVGTTYEYEAQWKMRDSRCQLVTRYCKKIFTSSMNRMS
jgi:hypothetical protein